MIQLYHADATEKLKEIEDNTIDLIITSPPYNLGYTNCKDTTKSIRVSYNSCEDNLKYDEYINWQIDILNECYRILKPTGVIYYNHKERHYHGKYFSPLQILLQTKLHMLQTIIWNRKGAYIVNYNIKRYVNIYETISVLYKSKNFMKIGKEYEKKYDIWEIPPDNNKCPLPSFPLELPLRIIEAYNNQEKLTILDPFMGSGTTGLASIMLKHNFIGIEIDKEYYKFAQDRLKNYQTRLI